MKDFAQLIVGTKKRFIQFDWYQYDGDDSFASHVITCVDANKEEKYNFDACSTIAIRKFKQFFSKEKKMVKAGFRIPEIIYYDFEKTTDMFLLHIYSEELKIDFHFDVHPEIIKFDKSYENYYN